MLTWVGCALAGVGCVLLVALSGADTFMDSFQDGSEGQFTRAEAQGILVGIAVVGFVWSVVASVLALLTVKRHGWARIVLTVSAVMAALVSMLTIMSVVTVVTLVLAVAAVVLLFVGGANDWFAHRSGQQVLPAGLGADVLRLAPHSGSSRGARLFQGVPRPGPGGEDPRPRRPST